MGLAKLYRAVSRLSQPFKFLAHLSLCGYVSGLLCLLSGSLLLAFFGSNIREEKAVKRIPTWMGIIATGSGIMLLFVAVILTILLCRLAHQQTARQGHQSSLMERFPSQPGLYPVQPSPNQVRAVTPGQPGNPENPETEKLT
ncbi:unnamed protein product [Ixodes persulcatus]